MNATTTSALIAAAVTLSACGGTATAPNVVKAQSHLDAIADADLEAPATVVMPIGGTAMYTGTFGIGSALEPEAFVVGDAAVEADFATGVLDGSVGNFLSGGTDGGFVGLAEEIDGSLAVAGNFVGADGLVSVNGDVDGAATTGLLLTQFKGVGAETLLGLGAGQVDGNDVQMYMVVDQ